jgi:hypothetical protein
VDVQQRRASGVDAAAQRALDQVDVIEAIRTVQINDEVHASATHAVADREMVLALFDWSRSYHGDWSDFLSGGTWVLQGLRRSQEGALAHAVLPNQ